MLVLTDGIAAYSCVVLVETPPWYAVDLYLSSLPSLGFVCRLSLCVLAMFTIDCHRLMLYPGPQGHPTDEYYFWGVGNLIPVASDDWCWLAL